MKFLVLCLSLTLLSSSAFAQTTKTYANEAIQLATIIGKCAKETADFFEYTEISTATHTTMEDLDVYEINFVTPFNPITGGRHAVATLKVSKSFVPMNIPAPDAPGGYMHYQCEVIPAVEN